MESKKLQETKLQSKSKATEVEQALKKAKKREKISVIRHDTRGEAEVMKIEERGATKGY